MSRSTSGSRATVRRGAGPPPASAARSRSPPLPPPPSRHARPRGARQRAASDDRVFVALGRTIAAHGLSVEPFRDLLEAFRRDAVGETRRFATWADVLEYCRRSANPVGQLVLALFGHRDAARRERSDDTRTALQLTNFWQDVTGDLNSGLVYLPEEHLERFPVSRDGPTALRKHPG